MALISRMSKAKIVPAVYQGPLTLGRFIQTKTCDRPLWRTDRFIRYQKTDKEGMAEIERRTQAAFDRLDKEVNPDFKYEIQKKD